jgi:hypothetical protein
MIAILTGGEFSMWFWFAFPVWWGMVRISSFIYWFCTSFENCLFSSFDHLLIGLLIPKEFILFFCALYPGCESLVRCIAGKYFPSVSSDSKYFQYTVRSLFRLNR